MFDYRLVFRHSKLRQRRRLQSTIFSHIHISEIAFVPRSSNMVVVRVNVQGLNNSCFCFAKVQKVVCTLARSVFGHTKQITYYVFHCLVMVGIVFLKSKLLASTKPCNANVEFLLAMRECVCGGHINHISSLHTFHESQIRYAHRGPSEICIFSTQQMGVYNHFWLESFCHCSNGAPLFIKQPRSFKSAWILWIAFRPFRIRHLSLSDLIR